jgi:hypothetical protein
MKPSVKFSLLALASLALAAMPLSAADKPEKPEGKPKKEDGAPANPNRTTPFHGKLASKTDSSITVGSRTFAVTAETKIVKAGKPAKLTDAVVGEDVGGSYVNKDGKLVAKSLRFGPKPEGAGESKEKKENKPKKEDGAE